MSKYSRKRHGIVLGSEPNGFFTTHKAEDGTREVKTFSAIVTINGYRSTNMQTYAYGFRTLAQQMVWTTRPTTPKEREDLHVDDTVPTVTRYVRSWLDANTPGWGIQDMPNDDHASVFFAKRAHALAFYKMVDAMLSSLSTER